MRSRVFSAGLIAALAACAPSAPPASAPAAASTDADVPPVLALLSERERLALQPSQVEALETIARDWEAANDTLTRRVGAVKGRGPNPLRMMLGKQALAAMAENNRRTAWAVTQVLRPEQREAFCTGERLRRQAASIARSAKRADGSAAVARAGDGKAPARSLAAFARRRSEMQRVAPWCASTPADPRSSSAH